MTAPRRACRRQIAFAILAATTALLVVGAVRTGRSARDYDRRFEAWLVAVPCDFAVDLSAPGHWEAPFVQTCDISHGEPIRLWTIGPAGELLDDRAVLDDLSGTLRIIDSDGAVVAETSLPGHAGSVAPPEGAIALGALPPFRQGEYRVQVEVAHGAPALAGIPQRLTAEYELCGMERLPAQLGYLLSGAMWVGSALAGLTTALVAILRSAENRATDLL